MIVFNLKEKPRGLVLPGGYSARSSREHVPSAASLRPLALSAGTLQSASQVQPLWDCARGRLQQGQPAAGPGLVHGVSLRPAAGLAVQTGLLALLADGRRDAGRQEERPSRLGHLLRRRGRSQGRRAAHDLLLDHQPPGGVSARVVSTTGRVLPRGDRSAQRSPCQNGPERHPGQHGRLRRRSDQIDHSRRQQANRAREEAARAGQEPARDHRRREREQRFQAIQIVHNFIIIPTISHSLLKITVYFSTNFEPNSNMNPWIPLFFIFIRIIYL